MTIPIIQPDQHSWGERDRRAVALRPGETPTLRERMDQHQRQLAAWGRPTQDRPRSAATTLWSSDYLGLSGHPAIVHAQIGVLQGGGDDLYMSAAYLGDSSSQRALERQMARFLGAEDAVLCQSGWCANIGLVQAVASGNTPVYIDAHAPASMWEGACSAGAPMFAFRHNDPESLRSLVHRLGPGLIVVEAIYGTDGSVCPLADVAEVGEEHGCQLMVDESHSIGVCGRNGQGLVSLLGLSDKVTYRTFSLSKALVTRVGMVTGPENVMEFFRYESRPAIFSSAVLPHEVAGLRAALELIQEEDWRRRLLHRNTTYLRHHLNDVGCEVEVDGYQIVPIQMGEVALIRSVHEALQARAIAAAPLFPPAIPQDRSTLRLLINCRLHDDDLQRVVRACEEVVTELGIGRRKTKGTASAEAEPTHDGPHVAHLLGRGPVGGV